jgi:hypothetical protein
MEERVLKNKGAHKPEKTTPPEKAHEGGEVPPLANLQRTVGNRAVQRLLAQRKGDGAFELDEETTGRISRARGGGQALDQGLQEGMGQTLGQNLSGVRVHTSPEANELSEQLHAKAFTTGQDIFFRDGAYDPASTDGQKLIAHELTHVVQQGGGNMGGGLGRMTVHGPGDAYEQEANRVSSQAVQRQEEEELQMQEEEEDVQMQEEEELQMQEEEEELQMQEEEEELQTQEEEELQMQEEEEELQAQEEEELQMQEEEEEELQAQEEEELQTQEQEEAGQ